MDKRKIIIGGRVIELESLGDKIDVAFVQLHEAYFGHAALVWNRFESEVLEFLDANPKSPMLHDSYFSNFTIIWNSLSASGSLGEAERVWELALAPVLLWEDSHPDDHIHKGTGYYFWGMTALQRGDLDKGYTLMHQAVEEDVIRDGALDPDSPPLALATLNFGNANQAFLQWVRGQMRFLDEMQNRYSVTYSRKFILDDFRTRFLLNPPSVEIVFLFSFAIARLWRLSNLPRHAARSRFAGQLEANILFDLALVTDTALRAKNPDKRSFIHQAEFLTYAVKEPLSRKELREISKAFKNDFNTTFEQAIVGVLTLSSGDVLTRLQCDIAVAYGLRNHEAHDVSSSPAVWEHFLEAEQSMMNVLFATVDYLY